MKVEITKKINSIKKILWENKAVWICVLLGAAAFVMIYGVHILNPCYTDWLLTGADGDLTQHYLGWKFFRHAEWKFPLGLIDTMAYPNATSVIFTDSIPLFALIFKIFRFMLPAEFQYFGWFGLLCFMLQGGIGAKLVKKYLKSDYAVVIGGLFFVLSPVFIDRMYWMTSLAAHFLCLLALLFIVYYDEVYKDTKRAVIGWGLLGALCGSIHIYFLPMCGVILLGFMLVDLVKGRKKWKAFFPLISYTGMAAATVFMLGGFGSGMKAGNDGVGYYSFNLNGFYNPQGWSKYLKDMPYTDSQYEGFGYLGLGILVLFLFAFSLWLGSAVPEWRKDTEWKRIAGEQKRSGRIVAWMNGHIQEIAYGVIILIMVALAASNIVMYNDRILYEIPLPGFIYKLWSVFRATGRLIWPVVYLMVLGAVCVDGKLLNSRTKSIMLTLCLVLQVADLKGMLAEKNSVYNKTDSYQTLIPSEEWVMIATEEEMKHICFVSDMVSNRPLLFSFGDYASDYGLTLSNFYFARSIGDKELQAREEALTALPSDTIFVFFKNEAQKCLSYHMNYYEIDDLIVGSVRPLGNMVPLGEKELTTYRYKMTDTQYMNNGEAADGVWNIHSYGNTYGPYLHAAAGRYKVTVTGSNLTAADVKCYYNGGETDVEPQNPVMEESCVTYEIELTEYVTDLEFALWNTGGSDMMVTDIIIEKQ